MRNVITWLYPWILQDKINGSVGAETGCVFDQIMDVRTSVCISRFDDDNVVVVVVVVVYCVLFCCFLFVVGDTYMHLYVKCVMSFN